MFLIYVYEKYAYIYTSLDLIIYRAVLPFLKSPPLTVSPDQPMRQGARWWCKPHSCSVRTELIAPNQVPFSRPDV